MPDPQPVESGAHAWRLQRRCRGGRRRRERTPWRMARMAPVQIRIPCRAVRRVRLQAIFWSRSLLAEPGLLGGALAHGSLARTVRDAALVLETMVGPGERRDPVSLDSPAKPTSPRATATQGDSASRGASDSATRRSNRKGPSTDASARSGRSPSLGCSRWKKPTPTWQDPVGVGGLVVGLCHLHPQREPPGGASGMVRAEHARTDRARPWRHRNRSRSGPSWRAPPCTSRCVNSCNPTICCFTPQMPCGAWTLDGLSDQVIDGRPGTHPV